MELLLVAVICGCQAGLYRDALHEIYWPRIQRGDASFAAKVLGARGALLSVLVTFSKTVIGGRPCDGRRGAGPFGRRSVIHPHAGRAIPFGNPRPRRP